jgi:hypothetical protein
MDGDVHRVMSGGQGNGQGSGGKEEGKKRRTFLGMSLGGSKDKDKEVSFFIPLKEP